MTATQQPLQGHERDIMRDQSPEADGTLKPVRVATSKSAIKKQERERCLGRLSELLKPEATVYTILRHVSRSGMMRVIDCYVFIDGQSFCIGYLVSQALGLSFEDGSGVKISGCGMDMGFAIVHELSSTMGFKDKKRLKQEWL
jgi:hypothetical protein